MFFFLFRLLEHLYQCVPLCGFLKNSAKVLIVPKTWISFYPYFRETIVFIRELIPLSVSDVLFCFTRTIPCCQGGFFRLWWRKCQ